MACVLLLSLGRKEFPVDVNVARICARLGWIPLDSEEAIEVRVHCHCTHQLSITAGGLHPEYNNT